ncbi:MAG TPA: hypothetical protein VHA54_03380 [Solirubrobacterales bacterium]|nr:hypothetical protein [Solirubrobacterales bacterium]
MAETKQAKSKKSRSKPKSSSSSSKSSKAKAKAKGNGAKAPSSAGSNGAQSHSNGAAPIMQKAKVPLIAGGAAVAGVAGAVIAATRTGGKRKVLGVSVPKRSKLSLPKRNGLKSDAHKVASAVTDAAKRADSFGQGVSRIASSVQKVGESADEAVKKS